MYNNQEINNLPNIEISFWEDCRFSGVSLNDLP